MSYDYQMLFYIKVSIWKPKSIRDMGVARGKGGNPPPPKQKKLLQKNDVISEGSIFSSKFSRNNKNAIFLLNFHQKLSKFSNNLYFSSKHR